MLSNSGCVLWRHAVKRSLSQHLSRTARTALSPRLPLWRSKFLVFAFFAAFAALAARAAWIQGLSNDFIRSRAKPVIRERLNWLQRAGKFWIGMDGCWPPACQRARSGRFLKTFTQLRPPPK